MARPCPPFPTAPPVPPLALDPWSSRPDFPTIPLPFDGPAGGGTGTSSRSTCGGKSGVRDRRPFAGFPGRRGEFPLPPEVALATSLAPPTKPSIVETAPASSSAPKWASRRLPPDGEQVKPSGWKGSPTGESGVGPRLEDPRNPVPRAGSSSFPCTKSTWLRTSSNTLTAAGPFEVGNGCDASLAVTFGPDVRTPARSCDCE